MVVKLTKVNSRDKNKCPQGRHAAMFPLFVFSPVFQVHWVFKFPIGQIESKSTARYLFTLRDIPIFSLACGILWPTESCGLWTCCGVLFSWILHWLPALWPSHFIVFSGKQLPSPPWPFKSIFVWSHTNPSFWNVWNIWCILCQELLACITTVITTNTRRITRKKGRQKGEEKPERKNGRKIEK